VKTGCRKNSYTLNYDIDIKDKPIESGVISEGPING